MNKFIALVLCFATSTFAADLSNVKIIGITTQSKPFQNAQQLERTILLGEHKQAFQKLFGNLPNTPEAAKAEIKRRQALPDYQATLAQFKTSAKDTVDAWQYGIAKLPAVLFVRPNGKNAVIYGLFDVNKAIELYRKKG